MSASPLIAVPRAYTPERIWQVRRAFFESGAAPEGVVDDPVLRSWRRCAQQGRDASEAVAFDPVERGDLSRLLAQHRDLLQAARPALTALACAVADAGYATLLTDAGGRALLVDGGLDRRSVPLRQAFRPGVDLSETMIGTNAMSAAMAERRSVSVLGAEHYFSDNQIFHCCATPVLDPWGQVVGAVDVSRDMPGLGAGVLALTQHCARQIERALFDACPAYLRLQLCLPGLGEEAWLAFDRDARLQAATPLALQALSLPTPSVPVGCSFQSLFETPLDTVLQAGQRSQRGQPVTLRPRGGVSMAVRVELMAAPLHARTRREERPAAPVAPGVPAMRFGDAAFEARVTQAVRAYEADLPVLITGETGTGKEVTARALHRAGSRREGPFVALNCGAIAPELMSAELFGHVEGAFTGAKRGGNPGKVEAAQGGTLLLDEIGDMPLALQVGLLRLLDSGEVVRVGGTQAQRVDVRFVCATHRDLRQMVVEGRFREDLYYRISAFTLHVPPLRERPAFDGVLDALLVTLNCPPERLSPALRTALRTYRWPGNVRQLSHALRVALAISEPGEVLTLAHFPQEVREPALSAPARPTSWCSPPSPPVPSSAPSSSPSPSTGQPPSLDWRVSQHEAIAEAMARAGGNVTVAATMLGMGRATLYRKLKRRPETHRQTDPPSAA